MTALAANAQRSKVLHDLRLLPLPVTDGAVIYDGALVCTTAATGLAVPASDAAGLIFQGVAHRGFDNTDGIDGVVDGLSSERYCEVDTEGPYSFAVSGATPKPGEIAYALDDNTVSVAQGTNEIIVGHFTEPDPDGSGDWFVDVGSAPRGVVSAP
jgi:hypothetical protein